MATTSKREISERIAQKTGQPRAVVQGVLQQLLEEIIAEMAKGNRLEFRDFGVFSVVTRKARTGRNPRTGAQISVPAKQVVSFKMGRLMRERMR